MEEHNRIQSFYNKSFITSKIQSKIIQYTKILENQKCLIYNLKLFNRQLKNKTDMVSRMEPDSDMTQMLELADKALKTATNPWPVR